MKTLDYSERTSLVTPRGNWNTAGDWFPTIEINQETGLVSIEFFETSGRQDKASVSTEWSTFDLSDDCQAMYIRGEVSCKNWRTPKCSGSQKFCFAIFVGDSGHIYTHRAPATKGWMEGDPNKILHRLRKLGIGVENPAYQQGDFLLKDANGNGYDDAEFKHETMGAGHHKFVAPVLFADGPKGRQYLVKDEPVLLVHHATDGIQHPDVMVLPGKYIVGTTASQLAHSNKRD
jgi:hypothetical protein